MPKLILKNLKLKYKCIYRALFNCRSIIICSEFIRHSSYVNYYRVYSLYVKIYFYRMIFCIILSVNDCFSQQVLQILQKSIGTYLLLHSSYTVTYSFVNIFTYKWLLFIDSKGLYWHILPRSLVEWISK